MKEKWIQLEYAIHPGEVLKEYLLDLGISQKELAEKTGINKIVLNEIINGKRPITIKTAIKLERAFSFQAKFWVNLQMIYDEAIERLRIKNEEQAKEKSEYIIIIDKLPCIKTDDQSIVETITKTNEFCFGLNICAA